MIENLFESLYLLVVVALSIYGLLGFFTLGLFLRYKNDVDSDPPLVPSRLPTVTVQIPIYNERFVIEQVIDAVVALDYPHDRLQIQVIDDSDDDTVNIARSRIAYYQSLGVDIEHLRRSERLGYKAGALADALPDAKGDYVAIFDADFHPMSDFLLKTIPYFIEDPQLGMVQARWGHLNSSFSALTAAQSIALDKHFRMEQRVRHKANMFPKFN
jgi:cellulose synthase/poly-beta-1,6-N-acetylglucosamine synthase-like glycosyltransferase